MTWTVKNILALDEPGLEAIFHACWGSGQWPKLVTVEAYDALSGGYDLHPGLIHSDGIGNWERLDEPRLGAFGGRLPGFISLPDELRPGLVFERLRVGGQEHLIQPELAQTFRETDVNAC